MIYIDRADHKFMSTQRLTVYLAEVDEIVVRVFNGFLSLVNIDAVKVKIAV